MKKPRSRSAIGRHSRNKGAAFERATVHRLRELWPAAKRGIGQARSASEVPDVMGTPIWWELKHHKRAPNVWDALEQGEDVCKQQPAMVLARQSGRSDVVAMRLDHFIRIVAKLQASIGQQATDDLLCNLGSSPNSDDGGNDPTGVP